RRKVEPAYLRKAACGGRGTPRSWNRQRVNCRRLTFRGAGLLRRWLNRRSRFWRSGRHFRFGFASNTSQRRSYRHPGVKTNQDFFNLASLEDFDLDCPLLGFDNGNDVAVLNLISGLDQPLNKGARLHIGAERGHAELGHRTPPYVRPSAAFAAAMILGTCGIAAISRCRG